MPSDTTLLDLDRAPTMEELKAFFKKHDWSAAKLTDPQTRSAEKTADMAGIKKVMDGEFEKIAREKGLGVSSRYYENRIRVQGTGGNVFENQGNPLLELCDSTEDLVADAVYEIAENHEDVQETVFSQFDLDDPDLEQKADAFLHNAVGTMLDVMEYDKLASLIQGSSAFEDFNPHIPSNFKAIEHVRRWYRLDTKHPTLPDPDAEERTRKNQPNPEDVAISNLAAEAYWKSLDTTDQTILRMLMEGYTQKEIAKTVGMANNSGVSKRIAKLRESFTKKTGMEVR